MVDLPTPPLPEATHTTCLTSVVGRVEEKKSVSSASIMKKVSRKQTKHSHHPIRATHAYVLRIGHLVGRPLLRSSPSALAPLPPPPPPPPQLLSSGPRPCDGDRKASYEDKRNAWREYRQSSRACAFALHSRLAVTSGSLWSLMALVRTDRSPAPRVRARRARRRDAILDT